MDLFDKANVRVGALVYVQDDVELRAVFEKEAYPAFRKHLDDLNAGGALEVYIEVRCVTRKS